MLALSAERKSLFEKDLFATGKGNPKPNEGFAVPIEVDGKVSVVRIELLPLAGRNEPILSLAEVQVFTRSDDRKAESARWATKPEWVDGKVHSIESGDHSVVYLRRSLNAAITGTQELLLGSGDISVYFTRITVGGVDFAVLEDRKFKSGPAGKIPQMGPRPDHINDPKYDPKTIDLPGLQLLGPRQEKFLERWSEDWTDAEMKGVLSQTAFCGAVHMHGGPKSRLLADLDCNGWPQTPRKKAVELIRRAWAVHLCGDQHLAVVVKHGISNHGDGPYGFTSPALVNTIYGRWWHPLDEQPGPNPVPNSPLPWTGDFKDGLGNKISMLAYANPENRNDEKKRADGYGIARFNKKKRTVTFECWPRFSDVRHGDGAQFPGWPITVAQDANDGRKVAGYLPELIFGDGKNPVVQVIEDKSGDVLYTVRARGGRFQPRVYSKGKHTVKIGLQKPDAKTFAGLEPKPKSAAGELNVSA